MLKKLLIIAAAASFLNGNASAAGDAQAGKSKAAVCVACHGAEGVSSLAINPNLAGQVPGYIATQLAAFKSGERENAIMSTQVTNLTDEDMADLDAYYASVKPNVEVKLTEEEAELAKAGAAIYRGGYAERGISACMSCHGPKGSGIPKHYPRVSAQHRGYLEQSLLDYKKGTRNGYNGIMHSIAFSLSEQQIKELAAYMAGLK